MSHNTQQTGPTLKEQPVSCNVEMVGVHASIETGSADETVEENGQEILRRVKLPEGQCAFWVTMGSAAFVVGFPLPDMRERAIKVVKNDRFDSFEQKCGSIRPVKPKYDIFTQSGTEVFVGKPRDRSTWECPGYSFTEEPWGEVIHHYEGQSIYEVRLRFSDRRLKRVKLYGLENQARDEAIAEILRLLKS